MNRMEDIYDEIAQVYLSNGYPWVVGFSGGKDSTATLQLVWRALERLPREKLTKHIYVVASDTLVEVPTIAERIDVSLRRMNTAAEAAGLPLTAHKVVPAVDDTFWVNLIGRGYPAPYPRFRWCTDRMKIEPTNRFIEEKVTEHGEVVVVLGVRKAESATRKQVIELHKITGSRLSRHAKLPGAYVYAPIEDFTLDDVWAVLDRGDNPWGGDNASLRELYASAQGEQPFVIDDLTPPSGGTRFGCWVCTVVNRDRSMEGMVQSEEPWMEPLLAFRDYLASTQDPVNKPEQRSLVRRNGQVWLKDDKLIYGPYDFDEKRQFRQELLRRLLRAQAQVRALGPDPQLTLIQPEELHAIRRLWRSEEGDWADTLPQIYEQETGESLDWVQDDTSLFGPQEETLLRQVCEARDVPHKLVKRLLGVVQARDGMHRRHNIQAEYDAVLGRDWRSDEEILASIPQPEAEPPEGEVA